MARDLPLSVHPKRFFKSNEFAAVFAAWDAVDASSRERLAHAVGLLRRSYEETDPIDRFEGIWGGLETVNPLLRRKHNLPDWYEGSPWPSCGKKTQVPGSSSSIRHAILELAGGSHNDWQSVRDLRQRIVHGIGSLSSAIPCLNQHLPLLRRALLRGIADLLNLPEDAVGPAMREPLAVLQGPEVLLTVTLDGVPDDCFQDSSHLPFFTIRFEEVDVSGSSRALGPHRVTFNVTFTPNNLTGTYSNVASELLVHMDPEDRGATLVMRGQRVIRGSDT